MLVAVTASVNSSTAKLPIRLPAHVSQPSPQHCTPLLTLEHRSDISDIIEEYFIDPTTPEPTTPEPTTPETTTPEPKTPEPTTPDPITPEPTTAELTTPELTTPEPTTPEPTTPDPITLEPTTAEPTIQKRTNPEPTTPKPTTSEPTTPDSTTPEPTTPEHTTRNPTTTDFTTPEHTTPEPTTPEPTAIDSCNCSQLIDISRNVSCISSCCGEGRLIFDADLNSGDANVVPANGLSWRSSLIDPSSSSSCDRQGVLAIDFRQACRGNTQTCKLRFDFSFAPGHSGWNFNIGDSSNDGYGGDSGHTSNAAEVHNVN